MENHNERNALNKLFDNLFNTYLYGFKIPKDISDYKISEDKNTYMPIFKNSEQGILLSPEFKSYISLSENALWLYEKFKIRNIKLNLNDKTMRYIITKLLLSLIEYNLSTTKESDIYALGQIIQYLSLLYIPYMLDIQDYFSILFENKTQRIKAIEQTPRYSPKMLKMLQESIFKLTNDLQVRINFNLDISWHKIAEYFYEIFFIIDRIEGLGIVINKNIDNQIKLLESIS